MTVICSFYVRTQVSDEPRFRYDQVAVAGPLGAGSWPLAHAPVVGDLVSLYATSPQVSGTFRVIERSWTHSSYGSYNWPAGEAQSKVPHSLDLIVEPADGPFRNEADVDEEGEYVTSGSDPNGTFEAEQL